jgi:putative Holliday junction resolvase
MRVLGLDVGQKRIGIAISDGLGLTAQGLNTIEREDAKSLENLIRENDVAEIVIGLPLNMNGSKGERAEDAILFGDALKVKFSLPVKMWDERLSTLYAEKEMLRGDLSRKKRKRLNDMLAAQLILQNYLDAKKSKNAER